MAGGPLLISAQHYTTFSRFSFYEFLIFLAGCCSNGFCCWSMGLFLTGAVISIVCSSWAKHCHMEHLRWPGWLLWSDNVRCIWSCILLQQRQAMLNVMFILRISLVSDGWTLTEQKQDVSWSEHVRTRDYFGMLIRGSNGLTWAIHRSCQSTWSLTWVWAKQGTPAMSGRMLRGRSGIRWKYMKIITNQPTSWKRTSLNEASFGFRVLRHVRMQIRLLTHDSHISFDML